METNNSQLAPAQPKGPFWPYVWKMDKKTILFMVIIIGVCLVNHFFRGDTAFGWQILSIILIYLFLLLFTYLNWKGILK